MALIFKLPPADWLIRFAIFGMAAAAVLLVVLIYLGVSFLTRRLVWVW